MTVKTRFAPSPTGPLHLGHAFSALTAFDLAQEGDGTFLLRIEDIDQSRCRRDWEAQIYDDLAWLGLSWPEPVMRQSENMPAYRAALDRLWDLGVLYACDCTRRDIQAALSAPQEGADPVYGPDGLIYPGTCRNKGLSGSDPAYSIRLNMNNAVDIVFNQMTDDFISCNELGIGGTGTITLTRDDAVQTIGDVVLGRRDMGTSYHLSVVVDDAAQDISLVVRGEDLCDATRIHLLLQHLLDLPVPDYHHHTLIRDMDGKRLAKRDDARAVASYRANGNTPRDIRKMIGLD